MGLLSACSLTACGSAGEASSGASTSPSALESTGTTASPSVATTPPSPPVTASFTATGALQGTYTVAAGHAQCGLQDVGGKRYFQFLAPLSPGEHRVHINQEFAPGTWKVGGGYPHSGNGTFADGPTVYLFNGGSFTINASGTQGSISADYIDGQTGQTKGNLRGSFHC